MKHPSLSVIIPAYNEADRLTKTLPEILKYFEGKSFTKEIIIVNDGSRDTTTRLIKKFQTKHPLLSLATHRKNHGKGAAVKTGMLKASGEWLLFMDADLSTPINQLEKFWPHTPKHQVIIGSRKMRGAKVKVRQNPLRENLGKIFTLLTNLLATKDLSDVTCGFKMYRGDIGHILFKNSRLTDWSFDAEILFLAQTFRYSIKEVPVEWHNDPRTKVNLLKDGLTSLKGLFQIRANHLRGYYRP